MDIPVQCPPDVRLIDIFAHKSIDIGKGIHNPPFMCYLQTPDNLKGNEPAGYPYFDFEAARQSEKLPDTLPVSESSTSTNAISVVCVDFGNAIDFSSQSFGMGIFVPIFFFFLGMGISSIYSVIRSL